MRLEHWLYTIPLRLRSLFRRKQADEQLNDELREMIMRNCSTDELRDKASSYGMITLRDAGMDAVYGGLTTVDEVTNCTAADRIG